MGKVRLRRDFDDGAKDEGGAARRVSLSLSNANVNANDGNDEWCGARD